jgi:tRNA (Thr-GGU) A37 N-methylase
MMQKKQQDEGYVFQAIGYVKSCFADRRGTPRQGILVPSARAHIKLVASIPPSSLEYLDQFSHLWVIFVFHENTNVVKAADSKNRSTFPAKIAPPRYVRSFCLP